MPFYVFGLRWTQSLNGWARKRCLPRFVAKARFHPARRLNPRVNEFLRRFVVTATSRSILWTPAAAVSNAPRRPGTDFFRAAIFVDDGQLGEKRLAGSGVADRAQRIRAG